VYQPTFRLPTLPLTQIRPNDTRGTFWQTANDEKFVKDNKDVFADFEELFKLNSVPNKPSPDGRKDVPDVGLKLPVKEKLHSLLDHTRLRNVAIVKRKLLPEGTNLDDIIFAVNNLDNSSLSLDAIELLQRVVPDDEERKAFNKYSAEGKDLKKLTEEDQYMAKLSKVERLKAKLDIMSFMSTFYEALHRIRPRIDTVALASKSTENAKKFQKILEIILAFGNYMNSNKKGSAYGFRMSSLDSLNITKSSDKKTTIVNFLVDLVNSKYPDLKSFESELRYIEKAMQFSMEIIITEVKELEKGMAQTQRELEARQNTPNNMKTSTSIQRTMALKDFCDNASKQLDKLKEDRDNAEKAFTKCLEHYGEDRKTMDTNTFFAILKRFCDSWKTAEEENIKREKLKRDRELKKEMESQNNNQNAHPNILDKNAQNTKKNNANLLADELKKKMNRRPVNHYDQDDVKDGTFEQMILDVKANPYCPRRSIRRTTERLMSRNFDEDL